MSNMAALLNRAKAITWKAQNEARAKGERTTRKTPYGTESRAVQLPARNLSEQKKRPLSHTNQRRKLNFAERSGLSKREWQKGEKKKKGRN